MGEYSPLRGAARLRRGEPGKGHDLGALPQAGLDCDIVAAFDPTPSHTGSDGMAFFRQLTLFPRFFVLRRTFSRQG